MKIKISREWLFVLLWSAFVVLLANIPYIYGYAIAPPDKVFMGDARCFIDTNTYLAWMHQASDGHILFKDIYTTEPHSRMFFHPFFLLLGNVARFTGLSLITVHGAARVICGFFLLLLCYGFVSYFIEGAFERSVAFILISISGGLGWLNIFPTINSIPESWFLTGWIEGNTFLSIYALPLFSASVIMLLSTFFFMLRSFEEKKAVYSIYAGTICFFLIFTHFFDALIVYPVLAAYVIIRYLISQDFDRLKTDTGLFAIMFALSSPAAFYDWWASMANPVFHEHAWKGAITLSPGFIWYLGGLGFVGIFAVLGIVKTLFDAEKDKALFNRRVFLIVWALSVPFLVYMPIAFQRRLVEGVHVPVAILCAIGLFYLVKKFSVDPKTLALILILAVLPNSLYVLHKDMDYLRKNAEARSMAGFLDKDILEGFYWLKGNTKREDVVICDYETGNYIPAVSGNTVFIGHSPETINFEQKWAATKAFFSGDTDDEVRRNILKASTAKYLFYCWKERVLGGFDPAGASYLKLVYNNPTAMIYEVNL